jgi:hypothetical protein
MSKRNTIKVYDGPSLIDGQRIIVLITGLAKKSKNRKTGNMLQTWIMLYDVAPHEAAKTGADSSVCGDCPLRPIHYKEKGVSAEPCYVILYQAPLSTWKANRDLEVTNPETIQLLIAGRQVRRGSYGDPNAVPAAIWAMLDNGERPTGYTHQWTNGRNLSAYVMASVHTAEQRKAAKAKGYRTFRIITDVQDVQKGEILCPASKEAGERTNCAKCGLCSGSKGNDDRRKDVAIVVH